MKMKTTALQKARQAYLPALPLILRDLSSVRFFAENKEQEEVKIQELFPLTSGQAYLKGENGDKCESKPLLIGVVFSGGQAPGGHNVITGIYDSLKHLHPQSRLFGFLNGPGGIITGKSQELTAENLENFRNQGGFDLIGSGRAKVETEEQLKSSLEIVSKMGLD